MPCGGRVGGEVGERICKWSASPTDGQVVVGASAAAVAARCKYETILADLDRSVIALVRGLAGVGDELGTVCAAELEARRVGGGDKCRELTGQGVDHAERVADRGVVVIAVETGGVDREHAVVGRIRQIECPRAGIDLDDIVEAGAGRTPCICVNATD
jgi:hypothetical protein